MVVAEVTVLMLPMPLVVVVEVVVGVSVCRYLGWEKRRENAERWCTIRGYSRNVM